MSKLYSIKEETLNNIADSVRAVTGATGEISVEEFAIKIAEGGSATLPALGNPASASDILSGKEVIDENGNVMTGTISTKTSSDLTASGATVTVPAGYYASQATKSVATATQATPSISISTAGKITASATQTAGYVSAGTKSGTKQLTTKAATTITPTTSSQTAVAKNVYTTGAITVAAIPSNYEDVADETTSQTTQLASLGEAITALETELAGKASGSGGSVETCTVKISTSVENPYCTYTKYTEDGGLQFIAEEQTAVLEYVEDIYANFFTLENVVCNSTISVYASDSGTDASSYLTTLLYRANNGRQLVIQAPSSPNVVGWFSSSD